MKKLIIIIFTLIIVAVLWFLVSPLFITTDVRERLPDGFIVPSQEELSNNTDASEKPKTATSETVIVAQGEFRGADSFHTGSGVAKVLQNGAAAIVRLEDFSVTNGPDLYVVLAENGNPDSSDSLGEHVLLEKLKGNTGEQNYAIPDDVDISQYNSVVIYCKAFGVVFAVASL